MAARVLQDAGVSRQGRDIARVLPGAGPMSSNAQYVTRLLESEINSCLRNSRGHRSELSSDQAERALDALDALGDRVRDRIVEAIDGGSDA